MALIIEEKSYQILIMKNMIILTVVTERYIDVGLLLCVGDEVNGCLLRLSNGYVQDLLFSSPPHNYFRRFATIHFGRS